MTTSPFECDSSSRKPNAPQVISGNERPLQCLKFLLMISYATLDRLSRNRSVECWTSTSFYKSVTESTKTQSHETHKEGRFKRLVIATFFVQTLETQQQRSFFKRSTGPRSVAITALGRRVPALPPGRRSAARYPLPADTRRRCRTTRGRATASPRLRRRERFRPRPA